MKFMVDCLPSPAGVELTTEQLFALLRPEFLAVEAAVELTILDVQPARIGADCPYEARPFSEPIVVVDLPDLAALTDYAANTGRTVMIMAASAWSSSDSGAVTLTHRMFLSHDGYCERVES